MRVESLSYQLSGLQKQVMHRSPLPAPRSQEFCLLPLGSRCNHKAPELAMPHPVPPVPQLVLIHCWTPGSPRPDLFALTWPSEPSPG